MGACIECCVFPVPQRDYGVDRLRSHPGLVWLNTSAGVKIPALHLKWRSLVNRQQRRWKQGLSPRPVGMGPDDDISLADSAGGERELTVLVTHGNAESLAIGLGKYEEMARQLHLNVFAVEYEGYGIAEGRPTEQGTYRDADAGLKYLRDKCGVPLGDIILFGRSLGSGPACDVAHRHPDSVAGVVLQSPLASAFRTQVFCRCGCAPLLGCCDMFNNQAKLPRVSRPVFIIHGTSDGVVPVQNGRHLHGLLRQPYPPLWVKGAGHNDVEDVLGWKGFWEALRGFVASVRDSSASRRSGDSESAPTFGAAACAGAGAAAADAQPNGNGREHPLRRPDAKPPPLHPAAAAVSSSSGGGRPTAGGPTTAADAAVENVYAPTANESPLKQTPVTRSPAGGECWDGLVQTPPRAGMT